MKVAVLCIGAMAYLLTDTTGQETASSPAMDASTPNNDDSVIYIVLTNPTLHREYKCGVEELQEEVLTRMDTLDGKQDAVQVQNNELQEKVMTRMDTLDVKLISLDEKQDTGHVQTNELEEKVMTRMDTLEGKLVTVEGKMDDLNRLMQIVIANTGPQWVVIQRRGQFGNPTNFFARSMDEYKIGFGNMTGEFWLGLDELARMTKDGKWEMQVDLVDLEGKSYTGLYNKFRVGAGPRYELEVGQYDSSKSTMGYDGFSYHNKMAFSSMDVDQDTWPNDCSDARGHGGWWYAACYQININGENTGNNKDDSKGLKAKVGKGGEYVMMKETEMKMAKIM